MVSFESNVVRVGFRSLSPFCEDFSLRGMFKDNFFDCVLDRSALGQLMSNDIDIMISEINRVLKPGGKYFGINFSDRNTEIWNSDHIGGGDFLNFEAKKFIVSEREINEILKNFDKSLIKSFEFSFDRLINYQSTCFDSLNLGGPKGRITRKFRTIDSVGMYIPGGKASYPSTVLMGSAPAKACGVKQISIASPALNGFLNPMVIAAAKVVGVDKIYKIGGAQAIAALALGTEQISRVE